MRVDRMSVLDWSRPSSGLGTPERKKEALPGLVNIP